MTRLKIIIALALAASTLYGQTQTVGLFLNNSAKVSPGYVLLPPMHNGHTYLINNDGQIVNSWVDGNTEPGRMAYLLPNGHLLRSVSLPNSGPNTGGGDGGRITEFDWNGNRVWQFDYSTNLYAMHHDLKMLPNGNVLVLLVETKTIAEMTAAGFRPNILQAGATVLVPDAIIEVQPIGPTGGNIVWEWHVWDHLVQNYDATKANYGNPAQHPELVDPNASPGQIASFWNHMNSIDYNTDLDQIMVSVRGNSELWIIDHSTTKAEAAGHTGGKYGKGGDLLYRWGNPAMYGAGKNTDEMLYQQHDAQWIAKGRPGAGNILVFNNGVSRPGGNYSSVDELVPPVNASGVYTLASGPKQLAWTYAGVGAERYYEADVSGAERQPNGNTLICYGTHGIIEEVTAAGEVVWKYVNPVVQQGPLVQGQTPGLDQKNQSLAAVFKARKYAPDYSGLAGQDLSPKGFVELTGASPTRSSAYPELRLLPAGEYMMGDHYDFVDPQHPSDERPLHMVWIDSMFIGTYDVTNSQYVDFLNSAYAQGQIEVRNGLVYGKGGNDFYIEMYDVVKYGSIGFDGSKFSVIDKRGNHPVGVRWSGAAAYTNWLSQQHGLQPCYDLTTWQVDFTKNGYRLPTEAEWEYAARAGQYNPYYNFPWGNDPDINKANWPDPTHPDQGADPNNPYQTGPYPWTTPVGFYNGQLHTKAEFRWPGNQSIFQTSNGVNAWGLYDMAGNVWQWVNDWYDTNYYAVSPYRNPPGPDKGSAMPDGQPYRNMRGGSWFNGGVNDPGHARVSNRDPGYYRAPDNPNTPYFHIGFRVARSAPALTTVSAASYSGLSVAAGSLAASFGSGLDGVTVAVKDSKGVERAAQVLASSAGQINFVMPAATAIGQAMVRVSNSGKAVIAGTVNIDAVAPSLFSANANGMGVAAAVAVHAKSDGSQLSEMVFQCGSSAGSCVATPLDLGAPSEQVILLLFGTGMRNFTKQVTATIGGTAVTVSGPVAQEQFVGLDQVNLGPLPRSLAGRGEMDIVLSVDGTEANRVTVNVK